MGKEDNRFSIFCFYLIGIYQIVSGAFGLFSVKVMWQGGYILQVLCTLPFSIILIVTGFKLLKLKDLKKVIRGIYICQAFQIIQITLTFINFHFICGSLFSVGFSIHSLMVNGNKFEWLTNWGLLISECEFPIKFVISGIELNINIVPIAIMVLLNKVSCKMLKIQNK